MEYFNPETLISKEMLEGEYGYFFKDIKHELTGTIPKNIADKILKENNDPNYTILIHRTAKELDSKDNYFSNGVPIRGGTDLEYTLDRYENDLTMMISINSASRYKNYSNNDSRIIIAKIPNSALKYEPGKTKPILFQTQNAAEQGGGTAVVSGKFQTVLLPEYVLGSIECKKGKITEFVENPNYTNVHDYKNNGLVCAEEVIYDYISKNENFLGPDIRKKQYMEELINNLIIEENDRYMEGKDNFKVNRSESSIKRIYSKIEKSKKQISRRSMESLKEYSLKDLTISKFKQLISRVGKIFGLDKENNNDQYR